MRAAASTLALLVAAGAFATVVTAGASPSAAQGQSGMSALDGSGFASQSQVDAAVGPYSITVVCKSRKFDDWAQRGARVALEKPGNGYRSPSVISTILGQVIDRVHEQCRSEGYAANPRVGFAEIYNPARNGAQPTLAYRATEFEYFPRHSWILVSDARKTQEERDAAQAQYPPSERTERAAADPTFQPVVFSDGPPEFPDTNGSWNLDAVADSKKFFGQPRYSMKVCNKSTKVVKIDPEFIREPREVKYIMMYGGINGAVTELLRQAIIFSWRHCPRDSSPDLYMIQSASIYAPGGQELYRAQSLQRTAGPQGPLDRFAGQREKIYVHYAWQQFVDIRHDAYMEQAAKESAIWWENFWFTIKFLFWSLIVGGIVAFFLWNLETFARWYFFYLYPHPARHMVRDALNTRTVLDGPALAGLLGELPPGNRFFRAARLRQGEHLVEQMQAMSRSIAAAQAHVAARQYERQAAEGYEQAAVIAIQEAIALAAVALERAKTAWQTSEAIRKRGRA